MELGGDEMGVFGAIGGALKAPAKAINKAPGMNALKKAVPGMNSSKPKPSPSAGAGVGAGAMMGQKMGLGPSPQMTPGMSGLAQAGAGIGNAFLQNRSPMPGGNNAIQPDQVSNPQPMNEAQSLRPSPMIQSGPADAPQQMGMYGAPSMGAMAENASGMYGGVPSSGGMMAQNSPDMYGGGIGPSPQAMNRRRQMM